MQEASFQGYIEHCREIKKLDNRRQEALALDAYDFVVERARLKGPENLAAAHILVLHKHISGADTVDTLTTYIHNALFFFSSRRTHITFHRVH